MFKVINMAENIVVESSCNPNLQYWLIKDKIKNLSNIKIELDETVNLKFFKINKKLDIFCNMEQYVEEFLYYFYAKLTRMGNIERDLVGIKIIDILKLCEYVVEGKFKEYSQKYDYDDEMDLIKQVFSIDEVNPILIKFLEYFCHFYKNYNDIYNSIKHGHGVIDVRFTDVKIDKLKYILSVNDEFVGIYCGNKEIKFYTTIVPINLLIKEVLNLLEILKNVFNFMMKTNDYDDFSLHYEQYENVFSHYSKIFNNDYTIMLPNVEEFNEINSPHVFILAGKFDLSRSTIKLNLSEQLSEDYPFHVILWDNSRSINPTFTVTDIFVSNSLLLDYNQILILNKINTMVSSRNNFSIEINREDFMISDALKIKISEEIINFDNGLLENMKILGHILEKKITLPFNLSPKQEILINDFDKKGKDSANTLLNEIENNAKIRTRVYVDIHYDAHTDSQYLGYTYNPDFYRMFVSNGDEIKINHDFKMKGKKLSKIIRKMYSKLENKQNYNLNMFNNAKKTIFVERYSNDELGFKENFLILHIS